MTILKTKGHTFPELKEADAMFTSDTAPGWLDGKCCHRCRVEFSFTQRKHHCRNCGQIFCAQCSSNTCTLPKFGIEKEVCWLWLCVCLANISNHYKNCRFAFVKVASCRCRNQPQPPLYLAPWTIQMICLLSTWLARWHNNRKRRFAKLIRSWKKRRSCSWHWHWANRRLKSRRLVEWKARPQEIRILLIFYEYFNEFFMQQSSFRQSFRKTASPEAVVPTNSYTANSASISSDLGSLDERNADPELAKYLNRDYWEMRGSSSFHSAKVLDSPASPSAPSPMVTPQLSVSSNSSLFGLKVKDHGSVTQFFWTKNGHSNKMNEWHALIKWILLSIPERNRRYWNR